MTMKGTCLITNDVETTSILNGGLRDETGVKVWKQGMPRLLDLYAKYDVKSTFFFIADFVEKYPEIVKMIQPFGHEVACHGLTHEHDKAFDVLNLQEQTEHLKKAKSILENIAGEEVISFRAPALRVNQHTPQALAEAGFRIDSSVAPQRMDMFMTLGAKNKLQWFSAPRTPYKTADDNLARKGNSPITEVPVSSFVFPYIGTFMRISPFISNLTRYFLYLETKNTEKAINFLIHPNELIDEEDLRKKAERRSRNPISHLLTGVLRKYLKKKNLGENAQFLLEKELIFWKNRNYEFQNVKDFVEKNNE